MRYFSLFILSLFLFISCGGESKISDQELIEKNVRAYFFMGDSVEVETTITDTIYADELNEMILTVEENMRLVQLDIDTLSLMIDDLSYQKLDLEKEVSANNLSQKADPLKTGLVDQLEIKILRHQLYMNELEYRKVEFAQASRIFMHLKRSIWADIAGFEANVHYSTGGEVSDILILMDANFNVVD